MAMTIQTRNLFLEWSAGKPKKYQDTLAIGIQNSLDKGEIININIAKEIIKATEQALSN